MEMTIILIAVAAAAAIASWALTHAVLTRSSKSILSEKEASCERIIRETKEAAQKQIEELKAAHEKQSEGLRAAHDEQIKSLKEMQEQQLKAVTDKMTVETEKLLRQREEELTKGNRDNMDEILSPLKESIREMKTAMEKNAHDHIENNTKLSEQLRLAVKEMQEKTSDIGSKADSLSEALTGKPKVQGCFGENFLDDILAREGLEKGKHYTREEVNSEGKRPDFVFHFKEGAQEKDLVVDSKVSLTAYVRYMNAESDDERKAALAEHIASIRGHINELSGKEYDRKLGKDRSFAGFVLMFMPIDMAFRVALDAEPLLWQEAYVKGVLITTEQTIVPFIKIMQLTWNKYQHDSNMAEIVNAAGKMIERVGLFYESYTAMGKSLKSVVTQYNSGIIKLRDGGQSITTSARAVMKFGAKREKGKELAVPDTPVLLGGEDDTLEQA